MAGESGSWLNDVLAAFSGRLVWLAVVMEFMCDEWAARGYKEPLSFFRVRWLMSGA